MALRDCLRAHTEGEDRIERYLLAGNDAGLRFWNSIGFEDSCITMKLQTGDDLQLEK